MAIVDGVKYWTDNEPVRGFDANAYLMSQSVMRFDNATDRDSALARSLTSGMIAYDKSTTTLQLYDGTSWINVATGTITVSPGGNDGQIQYNNGGAFNGASALYYDDVNSRVGIGTASPSVALDVAGEINADGFITIGATNTNEGGEIRLDGGTSYSANYARIDRYGNNLLRFMDQSAVRMSLDITNGNLSVSGTVSGSRLQVGGHYIDDVDGSANPYGSINVGGAMEWDGYAIDERVVFMHNGGSNWGIYNDVNQHWMIYGTLAGGVELKYNNTTRLWTDNDGGRTDGRHYTTGSNYAYSYYGHSNIAGTGNAIHTPNGIYSTGTNWLYGTILTNGSAIGTTSQQIGDVHANGWLRTYGQRGWYSQSYGGGWYMIDTTWLRTYNNKRIYSGSGQIRSDAGNGFNGPNLTTTYSYNTLRWNSSNGDFMPYASLTEMKTDITDIGALLGYLNERSLIYDLRPKIFTEANDRVDVEGNPVYTTRGEYAHGMLAEEVLEVAPELAYYDHNGELLSYGNDALIPDIIAELQRLMPMIEELYGAAHPDWVPPSPRPANRAADERQRYDEAAAAQAAVGLPDISDPLNGQRHLEDEE